MVTNDFHQLNAAPLLIFPSDKFIELIIFRLENKFCAAIVIGESNMKELFNVKMCK